MVSGNVTSLVNRSPTVARRMYAWRLGEVLPHRDIAVLRGIEGARVKEIYRLTAERVGIRWNGRHYDRTDPLATDLPNQALNHAASVVEAAAAIAVAATGTIPQLGFIHEDSGQSFILDIADLFRDSLTVPCAFKAAAVAQKRVGDSIERVTRRTVGERLRRDSVIPAMIDRIKARCQADANDGGCDTRCPRPLSRLSGLCDARDRTGYFHLGRAVARSAGTALESDVGLVGWNAWRFNRSGMEGRCGTRSFGITDPWITASDPSGSNLTLGALFSRRR
jgi:CRISPR associated protein Cas1